MKSVSLASLHKRGGAAEPAVPGGNLPSSAGEEPLPTSTLANDGLDYPEVSSSINVSHPADDRRGAADASSRIHGDGAAGPASASSLTVSISDAAGPSASSGEASPSDTPYDFFKRGGGKYWRWSDAPLTTQLRRTLGLLASLFCWIPAYIRGERPGHRVVDLEMIRVGDLPTHLARGGADKLEELGFFQLVTCARGGLRFSSMVRELARRVRAELIVEWPLVWKKWRVLALCGGFQYVHAIFTQIAYYMHQAQPQPLADLGFSLIPELGRHNQWVSEAVFGVAFGAFVCWTLTPFFTAKKRFYTVILYARWLVVLTLCQLCRIASFSSTQLPGPNYHCRSAEFVPAKPKGIYDILVVDLKRQTTHGCGDLIFSSHTTFCLSFVLFYNQYGTFKPIKVLAWIWAAILSVLIVASRKHYTVDVVIAWYTVPLVFFFMTRRWKTVRPLTTGAAAHGQGQLQHGHTAESVGLQSLQQQAAVEGSGRVEEAEASTSPRQGEEGPGHGKGSEAGPGDAVGIRVRAGASQSSLASLQLPRVGANSHVPLLPAAIGGGVGARGSSASRLLSDITARFGGRGF